MFSIITPTHQRSTELQRAVASVIAQSVTDWEMIIINDNPGDGATESIAKLHDDRITILENEENSGVNYSRNRGLATLSPQSDWVIFLDDDDTLTPNALSIITEMIALHSTPWLVTCRGINNETPATIAPYSSHTYSYLWDYLITRRFRGDATHCILTSLVNNPSKPIRFPTTIKQGEEWLFYSELGQKSYFYFENKVTTLTHGYETGGLNFRRRTTREQLRLIPIFLKEALFRTIYHSPLFWIYVIMRVIRAFIK